MPWNLTNLYCFNLKRVFSLPHTLNFREFHTIFTNFFKISALANSSWPFSDQIGHELTGSYAEFLAWSYFCPCIYFFRVCGIWSRHACFIIEQAQFRARKCAPGYKTSLSSPDEVVWWAGRNQVITSVSRTLSINKLCPQLNLRFLLETGGVMSWAKSRNIPGLLPGHQLLKCWGENRYFSTNLYRKAKQEKPGANQSTSRSSVPVSIQYRFVK